MAHKTRIAGTDYTIAGGRTLIGGTGYSITGGKTLVGGTAYSIDFQTGTPLTRFMDMLAAATLVGYGSKNSSSAGPFNINMTGKAAGTYYLLSFCNGYVSFLKVGFDGTSASVISTIKQLAAGHASARVSNTSRFYYSDDGTSSTSVYGGGLFLFTFSGYTESQTETIINDITLTRLDGVNDSTARSFGGAIATGAGCLATAGSMLAANIITGQSQAGITNYFSTASSAVTRLYYDSWSGFVFSTNETSAATTYRGSIIIVS